MTSHPVVDLVDEDAARDCVMPAFDLGDGFPTAMDAVVGHGERLGGGLQIGNRLRTVPMNDQVSKLA